MKTRPILFSAPMVRAILSGTKTQTRRAVKPQPTHFNPVGVPRRARPDAPSSDVIRCPYGQPGYRLWVRETWAYSVHALAAARDEDGPFVYAADGTKQYRLCDRWRPSILLEITAVRVERLQDISAADAIAEGVHPDGVCLPDDETSAFSRIGPVCNDSFPVARYAALWESINGVGAWEKNPLVWVIEFQRVDDGES